ncbi:MAG TPA: VWA domain-containing protein, partial [Syntrophales bacterium]|nr:VWA domain-containing protein [Syntrophales bacterium]
QTYNQAKDDGKTASLLEQQRPNVFQMNVANIMPGDEIRVEMQYTELIVPTDRVYEFVYPAVAGPRFSNQDAGTAPASENWVRNPYLHQEEAPSYSFDMTVEIAAGMPIRELASTSHKIKTAWSSPSMVTVALDPAETSGGNRDYILSYRLDGDRVQSGLTLFEGKKENFFLLMMQPPKRIAKADIPGREYIFIVDVSGSMYGFPLEISKKLLADLLGNLRPTDRFNVLLFSGGSSVLAEESLPATRENVARAIQLIESQKGGGGTELLPALQRALSLKKAENFSRTIVIATDGYVTVEEEVFDLIRNNLGNANMFAFGIGTAVNRHIIEGMARVGMGEPFVISKADEARARAAAFRNMIQSPVLTQVKVDFKGFEVYDVEPLTVPDILADRPVIVFGKWRGKAKGTIAVSGITGEGAYKESIDVAKVKPSGANSALRYFWARHRITLLSDYNRLRSDDKRIREVTELGLQYNLLTAYTSFVAVDSEVCNTDGKSTTVKQPLPLPEGVSDTAVGGNTMRAYAPMAAMAKRESLPSESKASVKEKLARDEEKDKKAAVVIADVAVSQGLSKEEVLKKLAEHTGELESCLDGAKGKLVLRLTINPDGTVKSVRILSSTFKTVKAAQCAADQFKKIRLPSTVDGKEGRAVVTLSA